MIVLFTALFPEVPPLLQALKARGITPQKKKMGNLTAWETEDGALLVVLTGSGEVPAAVTAARALTMVQMAGRTIDFVINFGTAAGRSVANANAPDASIPLYAVNKITEAGTGRDFYPDFVYATPFAERACVTQPRPVQEAPQDGTLCDMEAAGIFQAAVKFVHVERLFFLKVISDAGESGAGVTDANGSGRITAETLRLVAEKAAGPLVSFLLWLRECAAAEENGNVAAVSLTDPTGRPAELDEELQKALRDLNGSESMRLRLLRILHWSDLAGENGRALLRQLYEAGRLPAKTKREGKEVLKVLEDELL